MEARSAVASRMAAKRVSTSFRTAFRNWANFVAAAGPGGDLWMLSATSSTRISNPRFFN
jgi:hypothetical protein